MTKQLPPELRSLCSRLAVERHRAACWAAAAELRQQTLQRLARGEDAGDLADELRAAIQLCASAARARQT